MARTGDLYLSIDVDHYYRLPPDVRVRFDGWLKAETLMERHVVRLTLGEGTVTIERPALNAEGQPYRGADGNIAMTVETIPVSSVPPADAFRNDDRGGHD